MSFFGPLLKGNSGFPLEELLESSLSVLGQILYAVAAAGGNNNGGNGKPISQKQEDNEMTSSDVEHHLHLGEVGSYGDILRDHRPFVQGEDGDKYYVEADHIPPLDSLRRASREREYPLLWTRNPALYRLVESLRDDPRGRNLLTVQVSRHHHRDALSSGNSRESNAVRGLLAGRIARGEVTAMLRQAMIIAHPYASQEIRQRAGIVRRSQIRMISLSQDRTRSIYSSSFLKVINWYLMKGIITRSQYDELEQFILSDGFLNDQCPEYKEIFEAVLRSRRGNQ